MNPKFDHASNASSTNQGTSISWSHTLGTVGGIGLVIVGLEAEFISEAVRQVSSCTFNGAGMTFIGRNSTTGGSHGCEVEYWAIWGTSVPGPGTYTIAASWTGNAHSINGGALSFVFLKSQMAEASATNTGSGGYSISNSITTVSNGALLVSIYGSQNGPNATSTTGDTRGFFAQNSSGELSECDGFYRLVPTAGPTTVGLSVSNPESEVIISAAWTFQGIGGGFFRFL
jgi:hypothetical protein